MSGPWRAALLVTTAALSGAAVMIVELLAARLLAPHYGSGLHAWTAVIAVTLLALSVGYVAGGRASDRVGTDAGLFVALGAAGAALVAARFAAPFVLQGTMALGLRGGAVASALVLFAVPLALLGTVAPWVVKLATAELATLGSRVGVLYGASTLGSLAGTILAGYVLLPGAGAARTLGGTAAALLGWAGLGLLLERRRAAAVALAVLVVPGVLAARADGMVEAVVLGERWVEVHRGESFYGQVRVLEIDGRERELWLDGTPQSGLIVENGVGTSAYCLVMEGLSYRYVPGLQRALVIGLGAGIVPTAFARRGITADVVEIDPGVVEAYRRWFDRGVDGVRVVEEDGRAMLAAAREAGERWDVIHLDAFNGDHVPAHLVTVEAFEEMRSVLAGHGAVIANLVAGREPGGSRLLRAVVRTLGEVFDEVHVYRDLDPEVTVPNHYVVARDLPGDPAAPGPVRISMPLALRGAVTESIRNRVEIDVAGAPVLTDDRNPAASLQAPTTELRWAARAASEGYRALLPAWYRGRAQAAITKSGPSVKP